MKDSLNELSIVELATKLGVPTDSSFSQDFFVAQLKADSLQAVFSQPVKINGYCILFCGEGSADITLNLTKFPMSHGALAISIPGNLIKAEVTSSLNCSFGIIAASNKFVDGMNVNFNKLYEEGLIVMDYPCIQVAASDEDVFTQYYRLVQTLFKRGTQESGDAISLVVSSVLILLSKIWSEKLNENKLRNPSGTTRTKVLLEKFLNLVAEHHSTEKGVSFYAEELCITPKYLSKLIKNESGRSAPEWIDSFVMMDAKNLLRYSKKSIKEISYALNFSSLPAFYKFFKTKTGLTPKEYRENK